MPDNFPTDGPISLGDSLGTDKSISYFIGYCGGISPDAPYSLKALVELAQNEGIEFPNGNFGAPYSMSEFYAMLCGDACSLGTHNGDTFIISSSCSILMDDGSYVLMDSGDNLLLDDCVTSSGDTISCGGQDTSCCIDSEGSLGCVLTEGESTVDAESCATCCIELFDGSCILLADGVNSLDLAVCS
tara:strand:+ start:360 stop:920 length:561 start_codon:yes stop_codon:yes gene_type:complete